MPAVGGSLASAQPRNPASTAYSLAPRRGLTDWPDVVAWVAYLASHSLSITAIRRFQALGD